MRNTRIFKDAKVDFSFIAKNPATILITGGVLFLLIGKEGWSVFLLGLGILLHLIWIKRYNMKG
jgi:hypothetical protein